MEELGTDKKRIDRLKERIDNWYSGIKRKKFFFSAWIIIFVITLIVLILDNAYIKLLNDGQIMLLSLGLFSILQYAVKFFNDNIQGKEYYLGYNLRVKDYYDNFFFYFFLFISKKILFYVGLFIPLILGIIASYEKVENINLGDVVNVDISLILKKIWIIIFIIIVSSCVGVLFESIELTSKNFFKKQKGENNELERTEIEEIIFRESNEEFAHFLKVVNKFPDYSCVYIVSRIKSYFLQAEKMSVDEKIRFLEIVFEAQNITIYKVIQANKFGNKRYEEKIKKIIWYFCCKWYAITLLDDIEEYSDLLARSLSADCSFFGYFDKEICDKAFIQETIDSGITAFETNKIKRVVDSNRVDFYPYILLLNRIEEMAEISVKTQKVLKEIIAEKRIQIDI